MENSMKSFRTLQLTAIMIACSAGAFAQAPKTFVKDGLAFNYPSGWTLQDASSNDAQQLTLARGDSDAQIKLFVYRAKVATPEKLAEAQKKLVDPYIESTAKTFQQMGARPERSATSTEVGGIKAEGVNIRAVLDEPGSALIYWAPVGERLVVLTFLGPDKALKQQKSAWDTVRNSLKIEEPKPEAKPSPSPSPSPSPK
jgi:hypothetical protein